MRYSSFAHGVTAGILSALAGIIYLYFYEAFMFVDFSLVINVYSISILSIFSCVLMALAYKFINQQKKQLLKAWVNLIIIAITFISVLVPFGMTLPLEIDSPELFPGLTAPMHFFPVMVFFGLNPFFEKWSSHVSTKNN